MNKINVIRIAVIGLLGFAGVLLLNQCNVGFECVWIDNLEAYDENNRVQYDSVTIENLIFDPNVVFADNQLAFGDIIRVDDDSTYNTWRSASMGCGPCSFPEIDFTTHTLIGKYTQIGCNSIPFLFVEKEGDTYQHTIKAISYARCSYSICDNFTFGWITVPKMQPNETVEFNVGTAYYQCEC